MTHAHHMTGHLTGHMASATQQYAPHLCVVLSMTTLRHNRSTSLSLTTDPNISFMMARRALSWASRVCLHSKQ